jgi:hypothetical protein
VNWEIECCKVESLPAVAIFPICLGETCLTGLGNRSDRFWSQWPLRKIFGRHVVLCLRSPLVQVSPSFEFVCSSFASLSLSSLGETGVTGLGKRFDLFWCVGGWLSLAKPV